MVGSAEVCATQNAGGILLPNWQVSCVDQHSIFDNRFGIGQWTHRMSLDTLRELSVSIIRSSTSHPLGLVKLPSSTEWPFSPKEQRLLDLQRDLDSLSRQIVEARESTGLPE